MTWPDHERPCAWINERIEAFIDGDLDPQEASIVESHIHICRACSHELAIAQRVTRSLHSLPALVCPDEVVEVVYRRTSAARQSWWQRRLDAWRRPAFVSVMTAALVTLIVLVGLQWQQPSTVSAEEIELAEIEAKWAIAKVREVGQRATTTVRDDVLEDRVVKPIRRSMLNSIRIKTGKSIGEVDNAG